MALLSKLEKSLCQYLQTHHRGQENATSSRELEAVFHIKGTELRRVVNILRSKGHPICSNEMGYFFAANQQEVDATVAQLNSRISKIAAAKDGLLCSQKFNTE